MQVNPEEFRSRFENLSDDALIEIVRDDLTDVARDYYDAELAKRGLTPQVEPGASVPIPTEKSPEGDLKLAAEFGSSQEMAVARSFLKASGIPSYVQADFSGILAATEEDTKLYVPASYLEQAQELLATPLSDEELAAQAEAAGEEWDESDDEEELDEDDEEMAEEKPEEDAGPL